jgi:aldose 1-epimerase
VRAIRHVSDLTLSLSDFLSSVEGEKVSLHGGPSALDTVLFETIKPANSILFNAAELHDLKLTDYSNALFTATTPDGSNGFPGTLRIEVLIALVNPFELPAVSPGKYADLGSALIVYRARLMESGTITPINLTQASAPSLPPFDE